MAKARSVDAKLNRLRVLRNEAALPAHLGELRTALGDRSNLVVADAARIVGERALSELAPELIAAFDRFMDKPEESDKRCRAKIAIVEALNKIEYEKEDVFLTGIHHIQLEPCWGGGEDSAAPLRGSCAFGLVRINYPGVVLLLADLLADAEQVARTAAVQALGESRASAAIPLLRFKARTGDTNHAVTAECLTVLMSAFPRESLAFVAEFLLSPSEVIQEGAAFALAESRRPDALDILKKHWLQARHGSLQEVMLLAISMTRLPAAIDFLLEVLVADQQTGEVALSALAVHRHNDSVKQRIAAALTKKADKSLQAWFHKKFDEK